LATLKIRVCNAKREPLDDRMDVRLVSARTDATVKQALDVRGAATVKFEGLIAGEPYIVRVFPVRHRPVAQFAIPRDGDAQTMTLFSPIHPERVREARFPAYADLDPVLKDVLERSRLEGSDHSGAALYQDLSADEKAGLFNLFAKMSSVGFDDRRTIWSFVDDVYRVRPDRVFVNVQVGLHTPPLGFVSAGSYKTFDDFGNLQLSFFCSQAAPLAFKVDADIDDAAGLAHSFQVIRNFVTQGTTHPYDIHEILVFRQEATLPYDIA
jgi:hypothetical protein